MYIHITALCSARTTQTRRATVAKVSRERRKGIARTSQTCRNVSRVCRKVGARPSQRHRANVANLSQRDVARIYVAKSARDRRKGRHRATYRQCPGALLGHHTEDTQRRMGYEKMMLHLCMLILFSVYTVSGELYTIIFICCDCFYSFLQVSQ